MSAAPSPQAPVDLHVRPSSLHHRSRPAIGAPTRGEHPPPPQHHMKLLDGRQFHRARRDLGPRASPRQPDGQAQHQDQSGQVKAKKLFPQKLWDLINDERYESCLRWSDDGQLVYLNRDKFEECYLRTAENQFQTQKAISFVRQMNMYGFRKVDENYYENDNFKRGCNQLLKQMTRKNANKSTLIDGADLSHLLLGHPGGRLASPPQAGPLVGSQHAPPVQFQHHHRNQLALPQLDKNSSPQRQTAKKPHFQNDAHADHHKLLRFMSCRQQQQQMAAANVVERQLFQFVPPGSRPPLESQQERQHSSPNQPNLPQAHRRELHQPQRPPSGARSPAPRSPMQAPIESLSSTTRFRSAAPSDYSMRRPDSLLSSAPEKMQHSTSRSAQRRFKQLQPLQRRQPRHPQSQPQAASATTDASQLMAGLIIALFNAAAASTAIPQPQAPQVQTQGPQ